MMSLAKNVFAHPQRLHYAASKQTLSIHTANYKPYCMKKQYFWQAYFHGCVLQATSDQAAPILSGHPEAQHSASMRHGTVKAVSA